MTVQSYVISDEWFYIDVSVWSMELQEFDIIIVRKHKYINYAFRVWHPKGKMYCSLLTSLTKLEDLLDSTGHYTVCMFILYWTKYPQKIFMIMAVSGKVSVLLRFGNCDETFVVIMLWICTKDCFFPMTLH